MPRLLILDPDADAYAQILARSALPDLEVDTAEAAEAADPAPYDILLGPPDLLAAVLPQAVRARWVQSTWAGVRPLVDADLARDDLVATGVKGVFGEAMSEYVFGYLLMIHQRALERLEAQRARTWRQVAPRKLAGKTMGIMGVGDIGSAIAATARSLGMRVRGLTRSGRSEAVDESFAPERRMAFAQGLDVLVSTLPDTSATTGIIDERLLDGLAPESILVNVGRGANVDEPALAAALRRGRPSWAVLDVFRREPLPPDHPFWDLDNVFITCHAAALSHPTDIVPIFVDNYRRFREGRPLRHVVDLVRGY